MTKSKVHWLVRTHYQIRTASFAVMFVAIGMHMWVRGEGATAWGLLILQFLIYPFLVFWRARRAADPLKVELSNLLIDALLLGLWAAALEFSSWIAFALFLGPALSNAINCGWRGALNSFLAFLCGALAWILVVGLRISPQTELPVAALCLVGMSVYTMYLGNIVFKQNVKLRETRETLQREEQVLKAAQEKLLSSEERYRGLFNHMTNGFALHEMIFDADGKPIDYRFLEINPAFENMTGLRREQLIGKRVKEVLPDTEEYWIENYGKVALTGTPSYLENYSKELVKWYATNSYRPAPGQFVVIVEDITERKLAEIAINNANAQLQQKFDQISQLQDELRDQVTRDPLTGLYNRRYLDETLERELARARRESYPLCLLMIDLDHFKNINDSYGHQAGDAVLRMFSAMLRASARAEDIACRYGGEEFLLLMPKMPLDIALRRAEELRAEFAARVLDVGAYRIQETLSVGIAAYPDHGATPDQLTQSADKALYTAKQGGRNRVVMFSAS